nr:M3 family metallopeptidase [Tumebacillus amylolyticus]
MLESVFPSVDRWESALERVQARASALSEQFADGITSTSEVLLEGLMHVEQILIEVEAVFVYGQLGFDLDLDSEGALQRFAQAEDNSLFVQEQIEFLLTELSTFDLNLFDEFAEKESELQRYRPFLVRVQQEMNAAGEPSTQAAVSALDVVGQQFEEAARTLLFRETSFAPVQDADGNEISVTHGNYRSLLGNPDREFRTRVATSYQNGLKQHLHTWAVLYNGYITKEQQTAALRNLSSSLEAAMHRDLVDVAVYDRLVQAARAQLHHFHATLEIRQEAAGTDTLGFQDLFVPLANDVERTYSWEEAGRVLKEAMQPFGAEYVGLLEEALAFVIPNAPEPTEYTTNCYGRHPVVLMTYRNSVHSLLTLAHELGHAVHMRLANRTQPYFSAEAPVLPSEVAALTQEWAVLFHLIETARTDGERASLKALALEKFQAAFFRQSMLAEFERRTHELAAEGMVLSAEVLCDEYAELLHTYYGPTFSAEEAAQDFVRVTHLFNSFYLYTYPIACCAAVTLAQSIAKGGGESFIRMLSAGSSQAPADLLQIVGVDITQDALYDEALEIFKSLF